MKNKIINFINETISFITRLLPFIVLGLLISLISVPFPAICIEIIYVFNLCFAIYVFLYTHLNKYVNIHYYARLVQVFCIITCAAAIATTRTFLSAETLEEQIPFVVAVGEWICRDNYICGFIATALILFELLAFCATYINQADYHATKIRAKEELDFIKELEEKESNKEISKSESLSRLSKFRIEHCYLGEDVFGAKYIIGSIKAFILLYILAVGGGVAVGILDLKMPWEEALNQYVMLASGYLVFFAFPFFIATLSFRWHFKTSKQTITK